MAFLQYLGTWTNAPFKTKHLQEALADCGWDEARRLAQQDVSEAFSFVTDKLGLPLLELQMDVYHSGKEDRDDHRTVSERLLNVAIPNVSPEGTVIKLEDCLEQYFNNRIEVKRDLQRRNTISSFRDREPEKGSVVQVEMAQEESSSHPGRKCCTFKTVKIELMRMEAGLYSKAG